MADYGGLGGVEGGRPLEEDNPFEQALRRVLGARLRALAGLERAGWYQDETIGGRLYSSLTNLEWQHDNGDTASYSFRAAGDLIAALVGSGDYKDWYCSRREGVPDDEVVELMEGWHVREYG